MYRKTLEEATPQQVFQAVSYAIKDQIIDNWLAENCVNHRFSKSDATETMILYEQVRIPLYKANGMAQDTYGFARDLARFLKAAPYNIPVKTVNRGLGRCLLILGEK